MATSNAFNTHQGTAASPNLALGHDPAPADVSPAHYCPQRAHFAWQWQTLARGKFGSFFEALHSSQVVAKGADFASMRYGGRVQRDASEEQADDDFDVYGLVATNKSKNKSQQATTSNWVCEWSSAHSQTCACGERREEFGKAGDIVSADKQTGSKK